MFRGHYEGGFEQSAFVMCEQPEKKTWLTWTPGTIAAQRKAWERIPRQRTAVVTSPPPVFVQVHGTLVGPGHYGHMSGSAFELFADSLLDLRLPAADDCR